jgi:hypothetical protein
MHTQERKLPVLGKGGELPAERSYSIGLAEAVGEESDAKWRYQQVVPLTGICSTPRSNPPRPISIQRFLTPYNIVHYQNARAAVYYESSLRALWIIRGEP